MISKIGISFQTFFFKKYTISYNLNYRIFFEGSKQGQRQDQRQGQGQEQGHSEAQALVQVAASWLREVPQHARVHPKLLEA